MAKNNNLAPVSLSEERDALLEEQTRPTKPISASGIKKVARVHELKELMSPYLAEIEEIKGAIFKEMDNKGVDVLTRKGVEVVSRDKSTLENLDKNGLKASFPEIAIQFIVTKIVYRVNWKNRFTL